ncbi:SubName: Full=Uncharacterized protein {ECO:0000313/EMBL:CCA68383.1} [Serendipita indica DSM 11827]|nr:SubName: Full=Uncharacterized protein {ECO:0000313/EMBL:CCA68383.1} [Serendipita indica DSM 11827]
MQVRDARTGVNRQEMEDLRKFLDSGPQVFGPPASISTGSSLSKASVTKRSGISFFRSKRRSFEWQEVNHHDVSHEIAKVDDRMTPRKLGSHTVLMINYPTTSAPRPFSRSISAGTFLDDSTLGPSQIRSASLTSTSKSLSPLMMHHTPSRSPLNRPPGLAGSTLPLPSNGSPRYSHIMREELLFKPPSVSSTAADIMDRTASRMVPASSTETHLTQRFVHHRSSPLEPRRAPIPQTLLRVESEPLAHAASRMKVTKEVATQTDNQESFVLMPNTHGSSDETLSKVSFPLTPPPSNTTLSTVPAAFESKEDQASSKHRNRKRKGKAVVLSDHYEPDGDLNAIEMELTRIEDKDQAFGKLWELYESQKALRRAENEMHQWQIADLKAGYMAEKMAHRRIARFLAQSGMSPDDICTISGVSGSPSLKESTLASVTTFDMFHLDKARFTLLGKQVRLNQMEQFSASCQHSPEGQFGKELNTLDASSGLKPRKHTLPSPSPVPTIPLPPIPTQGRNARSLIISSPRVLVSPIIRSKSLNQTPKTTFADAIHIDERMALLEADFIASRSHSTTGSTDTISLGNSPQCIHPELPCLVETDESPLVCLSSQNSLLFDADCEDNGSSQGSVASDRHFSTCASRDTGITALPDGSSLEPNSDLHPLSRAGEREGATTVVYDGAVDTIGGHIQRNNAAVQCEMSSDQEVVEGTIDSSLDGDKWAAVFCALVGNTTERVQ